MGMKWDILYEPEMLSEGTSYGPCLRFGLGQQAAREQYRRGGDGSGGTRAAQPVFTHAPSRRLANHRQDGSANVVAAGSARP